MKLSSSFAARAVLRFIAGLTTVALMHGAHAAGISGQGTWETTLQGRDLDGNTATFEAYYDTVLNITWLADANYDQVNHPGNTFGDGRMTWNNAVAWSQNLNVNGKTGWRLPRVNDEAQPGYGGNSPFAFNPSSSSSELAHMFLITLGHTFQMSPGPNGPTPYVTSAINYGPFSSVEYFAEYWSGTTSSENASFAFVTGLMGSSQNLHPIVSPDPLYASIHSYAWVVRDGDIGAVPEPSTWALMAMGLAALVGLARAKAHRA